MLESDQGYAVKLPDCSCCPRIKAKGGKRELFFLPAAHDDLCQYFGEKYLNVDEPQFLPPVIKRVRDQEQKGFDAEYGLFRNFQDSKLPMYVFTNLRPLLDNNELADFVILFSNKVIVLEVKAFVLEPNPGTSNLSKYKEVVKKGLTQIVKARKAIEKYWIDHVFVAGSCSLPLETFLVLPNAERCHHESHLAKFEQDLKSNPDCEYSTKKIVYKDEILEVLKTLLKEEGGLKKEQETLLRTVLAWFYGSYCFDGISQQLLREGEYTVKKELDEEHMPKKPRRSQNKQKIRLNMDPSTGNVAGVFLTPAQMLVIDSDENFLMISGFPGTGKTYCLLAKVVKVYEKMLEERTANSGKDGIILVIHKSRSTVAWIKDIFFRCIGPSSSDISNIIQFLSTEELEKFDFKSYSDIKLFVDDYSRTGYPYPPTESNFHQLKADVLAKVTLLWLSSRFSRFPLLQFNAFFEKRRYFNEIVIRDNLIYNKFKLVCLDEALRFSANICRFLCGSKEYSRILEKDFLQELYPTSTTRKLQYRPGTRVVGDTVKFIPTVKDKLIEVVDEVLKDVLKHFKAKDVKILLDGYIHSSKFIGENSFLQSIELEEQVRQRSEAANVSCSRISEILGQEFDCVIYITGLIKYYEMDCIGRAISKLVLIEVNETKLLAEKRQNDVSALFELPGPEIRQPKAKRNNTEILSFSKNIDVFLTEGKVHLLHRIPDLMECGPSCVQKILQGENKCVKNAFKIIEDKSTPKSFLLQKRLHFQQLSSELETYMDLGTGLHTFEEPFRRFLLCFSEMPFSALETQMDSNYPDGERLGTEKSPREVLQRLMQCISEPFCEHPSFATWILSVQEEEDLRVYEDAVKKGVIKDLRSRLYLHKSRLEEIINVPGNEQPEEADCLKRFFDLVFTDSHDCLCDDCL